ncbi:MAG: sulfatase-like hydrolase/transferase [Armatimonadota bacterium]|nr:sulfatase-like hydrolase/transferase [Armatimonadota bacterium]
MNSFVTPERIGRREAIRRIGSAVAGIATVPMLSDTSWAAAAKKRKPNIVLIVADDLGCGDLGCYGCPDIATPNIDRLAAQGARFTQSYVSAPLCSPTRVSILTGKYPLRTSLPYLPSSKNPNDGLSPDEITLAEVLKSNGYATGIVGKWHLGYAPRFRPLNQGFDEFYGYLSGWADYINHTYNRTEKWMFRNNTPFDEPGYTTDLFSREARAFIEKHKKRPFFLYLPFGAPHGPLKAPDGTTAETRDVFRAIMENFDYNVGQVMRKLKETGLENDTFVIFVSDNGADGVGSNAPFKGKKRTLYEGGIRTPFMARWPGRIKPGTVVAEPIICMDIFNTAANAAGARIPAGAGVDGRDVLNVMQGKAKGPHEILFWTYQNKNAVRRGQWKLVTEGDSAELYDLNADPSETTNRAAEQSSVVQDLQGKLKQWKVEVTRGKSDALVNG